MTSHLATALTVGALLWSALLLVAPFALRSDSPAVVAAAALFYESAGLICHQRPERSFHLAGAQLAVCGRCAGLYFAAALGVAVAWLVPPRNVAAGASRVLLAVAAAPTAITVALEWIGLASPSNSVRAIAALPLGFAAAALFVASLRYDRR